MRQVKNQLIGFVFILLIVLVTGSMAEEQVIARSVAGIELGMSLQEVSKVFQMEEKEEGVVVLMRKFGFGDPEKQSKINKKLGKQVFAIKDNLPKGVASTEVFFRNGIFYQIALHYGKDYVQKIDWELFTLPAIKKYGQPIVLNNVLNLSSFSYQWIDGQTKLEIAKGGTLSKDKNKFDTTIYNVFYTDIGIYNVMKNDEKIEEERSTAVPEF